MGRIGHPSFYKYLVCFSTCYGNIRLRLTGCSFHFVFKFAMHMVDKLFTKYAFSEQKVNFKQLA